MKVYLALEYFNNGQAYEDRYDNTELIGTYDTTEAAGKAIERFIEDQHLTATSISTENETLPEIRPLVSDADIIKYRAMCKKQWVTVMTWQYYILPQEIRS